MVTTHATHEVAGLQDDEQEVRVIWVGVSGRICFSGGIVCVAYVDEMLLFPLHHAKSDTHLILVQCASSLLYFFFFTLYTGCSKTQRSFHHPAYPSTHKARRANRLPMPTLSTTTAAQQ
jgi:hypothetical protein